MSDSEGEIARTLSGDQRDAAKPLLHQGGTHFLLAASGITGLLGPLFRGWSGVPEAVSSAVIIALLVVLWERRKSRRMVVGAWSLAGVAGLLVFVLIGLAVWPPSRNPASNEIAESPALTETATDSVPGTTTTQPIEIMGTSVGRLEDLSQKIEESRIKLANDDAGFFDSAESQNLADLLTEIQDVLAALVAQGTTATSPFEPGVFGSMPVAPDPALAESAG